MNSSIETLTSRIVALEARFDCLEGHRARLDRPIYVEADAELPMAITAGLSYVGRGLFFVAGRSGLWCRRRDRNEPDAEAVVASQTARRCKGRQNVLRLYRLHELSEMVMRHIAPETPIEPPSPPAQ